MDITCVNEVEAEARRFLKKVAAYKANRDILKSEDECHGRKFYEPYQCKYAAAMKRASMDLTRALVKIR